MIYTHVLNRGGLGVRSPADLLADAGHLQAFRFRWIVVCWKGDVQYLLGGLCWFSLKKERERCGREYSALRVGIVKASGCRWYMPAAE